MGSSELLPANVPAQQMTTTPADLLAMAVSQGADLDKLDKLMQLQERWEANEARKAFTVAMTGFRSEPVDIYKTKNVSFSGTSYNHAELSDVTQAINPALAKHNLSFRWDVTQDGNAITVACSLTHIAGHSERVTMTAPPDDSGKKNKIQQIASTVTYLQRYTLLAITGMSTKGMDDDGKGYEAPAEDDVPNYADWEAAIAGESTVDGLKHVKNELVGKFGDAIPKVLVDACVTRMAAIKGAAK